MKKGLLMKHRLLYVDAMHDGEGWSWNNWYTLDEIDLADNLTEKDYFTYLLSEGWLTSSAIFDKNVCIFDDGYNIEVQDVINDAKPVLALCYGEYL